jgi:ketosteroid isomerase-like protein
MNRPDETRETYMRALIDLEQETALSTYADELVRFPTGPSWFIRGKEEARGEWRTWLDSTTRYRAFRWLEGPFGAIEGDLAWFAGIVEQDYQTGDGMATRHVRMSMVLRRGDDGWKIVMEHNSLPYLRPYEVTQNRYR